MQVQRLIHLSDSHLPAESDQKVLGFLPFVSLSKVIDEIASLDPAPNAIAATGDLADGGTAAGYELFKHAVTPLHIPVFCLPGNHDNINTLQQVADQKPLSVNKSVAIGVWRLISLNSKVPGQSHGHLDDSELEFLQQELTQHSASPTIVALHHTPCSPCVDPGCQLDNREQLMSAIAEHQQVKLVLAGHTHQADKTRVGRVDVFTAPSTFAQASHPDDESLLDPDDFFATHALDGSKVGFSVFDLHGDGEYVQQWHRIEV